MCNPKLLIAATFLLVLASIQLAAGITLSFAAPRTYTVGTPGAIAVGDFNRDGNLDLVVTNSGSSNITILLGNGDGSFGPPANYPVGLNPGAVAVAEFNGDG